MRQVRVLWLMAATLGLGWFPGGGAQAALRDEFAWSLPLEVPAGAPVVRLDLPLPVYRDSVDPSLSDLRVLNGAGEVVPFAIRRPAPAARGIQTTLSVPFFPLRGAAAVSGAALQLRIDAGKASIEVEGAAPVPATAPVSGYLLNTDNIERAIDGLTFNWPDEAPDFAMSLIIAASDDLVQWRVVVPRAPLARLRHAGERFEQRSVVIPATRARFWRVSAEPPGELPEITMTAVTLVSSSVPIERLEVEVPGSTDPQQAGMYFFDLGAQLPIDRVKLLLPDVNTVAQTEFFSRRTADEDWRLVNSTSVHRIRSAYGELSSDPLTVSAVPQRFWRVKVDPRGGGIGGGMPRLRAGWLADQVVFMTRGAGPFELVYGSAITQAGGAVAPEALLPAGDAEIPQAYAGERREAGGPARLVPPPPPGSWRIWILWAALIAGVAVLGTVAFKLARQMRAAS